MDNAKKLLGLSLSILLASCGGGGGSSTGTNAITYTGSKTGATLDEENAPVFIEGAFTGGAGGAAALLGAESSSLPSGALISETLNATLQNITRLTNARNSVLGVEVDDTTDCTSGGTLRLSGNASEANGDFTGKASFNNCTEDEITINGDMNIDTSLDLFTLEYDAPFNSSFTNLSLSSPNNFESTLSGDLSCRFDESPNVGADLVFSPSPGAFWCNQNLLIRDDSSQKVFKLEDFEVVVFADISINIDFLVFKGRYFNPDHGYVDVSDGPNDTANTTTRAAFIFYTPEQSPIAGSGLIKGNNNSSAEIIITSGGIYDLYLDTDGDGVFDFPLSKTW